MAALGVGSQGLEGLPHSMSAGGDARSALESIRVKTSDAAESDLELICPPSASVGVLWLPALGVTSRNYQTFARSLAEQGVAVALHEWRGAGSSNVRAARDCDWGYRELLEIDIPASLAAARAAHPQLRWVVGGHSLGAQLGALLAGLQPELIEGFVLVASGSPYWRTFSGKSRRLLRCVPLLVQAVTALCGYYPGKRLGFAGREASRLMRDWAQSSKTGRYENYFDGSDSERGLVEFGKPVLGIRLSDDRLCPEASFEWLLAKFQRAPVERVLLSSADFPSGLANHFSWLKDPHPVAKSMATWVRRMERKHIEASRQMPL